MNAKAQGILKAIAGVLIPIIVGAIAWCFQLERRVSAIEVHQSEMVDSLGEMKSDIHEIRNVLIEEIRGRNK